MYNICRKDDLFSCRVVMNRPELRVKERGRCSIDNDGFQSMQMVQEARASRTDDLFI